MTRQTGTHQSGFTLLEIVITVVVTAILSALILQAMGTNIQRSAFPLFAVRNTLSLQEVMENITADYKQLFLTDSDPMATFEDRIKNAVYWSPSDAYSYQYDSVTFTSADGTNFTEKTCDVAGCDIYYRVTITQKSSGRSLSALFAE